MFRPFVALPSTWLRRNVSPNVKPMRHERRAGPRFPTPWRLEGRGISFFGFSEHREEVVRGQIQNFSRGGLCLLSESPLQKSSVLRCEIIPDSLPAGIPTIMEVRWMASNPASPGTRVGLRFLT